MKIYKIIIITVLIHFLSGCGGGSGGSNSSDPQGVSSSSVVVVASSSQSSSLMSSASSAYSWSSEPALKELAKFPIGMEVSAADETRSIFILKDQLPTINKHFNSLVAGVIMKMRHLHPAETQFFYTDADNLWQYASDHGMILHGHTLIWHWDSEIPDWMKNYSGDWESMLNTHVSEICKHYAGKVYSWDVVNEALDETTISGFRESIFYKNVGKKYIENAFIAAHQADPNAVLYYNDYAIDGSQKKLDLLLSMLDDFKARNIPVQGVGFQMHITLDDPSIDQIKKSFKAVADRGYQIRISEFDMMVNLTGLNSLTNDVALAQKNRFKSIVQAYLGSVPENLRAGITFWGLVDGESWINYLSPDYHDWPLLFNNDYTPKPAFYGVAEALAGK